MHFFPGIDYNRRYNVVIIYTFGLRIYLQCLFPDMNHFLPNQNEKGTIYRGRQNTVKYCNWRCMHENWGRGSCPPSIYVKRGPAFQTARFWIIELDVNCDYEYHKDDYDYDRSMVSHTCTQWTPPHPQCIESICSVELLEVFTFSSPIIFIQRSISVNLSATLATIFNLNTAASL